METLDLLNEFYVYLHCKPGAIPFYVGKGKNNRCRNFSHRNPHHLSVIKKYGKENIEVYTFPCESEEQAFEDEIRWIDQLTLEGWPLANKSKGGEGNSGYIHTQETKEHLSIVLRGKPCIKNSHPLSEEHRQNISKNTKVALNKPDVLEKLCASSTELWKDPTYRTKVSKGISDYWNTPGVKEDRSSVVRKALSNPETRAKMSAARLGKKMKPMSVEGRSNISAARKGTRRNEDSVIHIKINNEVHNIQDWADIQGIRYNAMLKRIHKLLAKGEAHKV